MDDRTLWLGLVAAVVVVAGALGALALSGGPDGGGDGPRSVEDLTAEDLPPGVTTEEGLTDAAALARAHDESLDGRAFRARLTVDVATETEGGTREVSRVQTAAVDGEGRFLTSLSEEGATSFTRTVWGNESVGFERLEGGGATQLGTVDPARTRERISGYEFIRGIIAVGDFALANVSERDGRTVLELRADAAAEGGAERMDAVASVASFSGRLVVGTDGRIYRMAVEMTFTDRRGRTNTATFGYELSGLGSTEVDRPDWVAEAASRTGGRLATGIRPA